MSLTDQQKKFLIHILGSTIISGIIFLVAKYFSATRYTERGILVGVIAGTTMAMIMDVWKNRK